jgi:hypothetical protein
MSATYKYIVDIIAKNSQFVSTMNQNVQKVNEVDKKVKAAQGSVNSMTSNLGKLAGAVGIAFSAGAVIAFGKASTQAYNDSIQAETALLTALKGRTDIQRHLIDQASELMGKTLYDDDEIVRAQSLVAAFVKEENKIKTLIPLIQDFAAAKQMDLASAADLVTKALAGEINALGRYGIKVEGTAGSSERLTMITKGLNDAFGGQAEAAAKVGTAALTQLANEYENVQEAFGKMIIATQNKDGSFTKGLQKDLQDWTKLFDIWSSEATSKWDLFLSAFSQNQMDRVYKTVEIQKAAAAAIADYDQMIKVGKSAGKVVEETTETVESASKYAAGSVGALGEELGVLNEQLANTNANDIKSIQIIGAKIAALEKYQAAVKNISSDPTSFRKDSFSSIGPRSGKVQVSGSEDTSKWSKQLMDMSEMLEKNERRVKQWREELSSSAWMVADAFGYGFAAIGESIVAGLGLAATGFEGFVGKMAEMVTQVIAMAMASSVAHAIEAGSMSALGTGFLAAFTTPAFIATAIGGVMAAFAAIPKFETGGIVPGSSMYGDKMMVRVNSGEEVLTRNDPRHRLNSQSGFYGGGGSAQTVILQPSLAMRGDSLRVMLKRVDNNARKRT